MARPSRNGRPFCRSSNGSAPTEDRADRQMALEISALFKFNPSMFIETYSDALRYPRQRARHLDPAISAPAHDVLLSVPGSQVPGGFGVPAGPVGGLAVPGGRPSAPQHAGRLSGEVTVTSF